MTERTTRKVRRLMVSVGMTPPLQLDVERTYAGRNQRSIGYVVWIAKDGATGRILCGSGVPIRDLRVGAAELYQHSTTYEIEIVPKVT